MITIIIMTLLLILTSESSSLESSPKSPPLHFKPIKVQKKQGYGKQYGVHHPAEVVEDYGPWDPSPGSGGGNYSPIPHGEVS